MLRDTLYVLCLSNLSQVSRAPAQNFEGRTQFWQLTLHSTRPPRVSLSKIRHLASITPKELSDTSSSPREPVTGHVLLSSASFDSAPGETVRLPATRLTFLKSYQAAVNPGKHSVLLFPTVCRGKELWNIRRHFDDKQHLRWRQPVCPCCTKTEKFFF